MHIIRRETSLTSESACRPLPVGTLCETGQGPVSNSNKQRDKEGFACLCVCVRASIFEGERRGVAMQSELESQSVVPKFIRDALRCSCRVFSYITGRSKSAVLSPCGHGRSPSSCRPTRSS